MGFKDDFSAMVNRGASAASRKARQVSLNSRANELRRQRQTLVAQLGASLYETVRVDPALRAGREELISQIEALDEQRRQIDYEQERLRMESEDAAIRATTVRCAVCGAPMRVTDQFCGTCGASAERAMPHQPSPSEAAGPVCPNCGAPIELGDAFCMSCGTRISVETVEEPVPAPAPASTSADRLQPPVQPRTQFSPSTVERVTVESVDDDIPASPFLEFEHTAEVVADGEDFAPAGMDEIVTVDGLDADDGFASAEVAGAVEVQPAPTDLPPVSNEELESEMEFAIAEELNVEEMVEELRDEIHDEAPAPSDEAVETTTVSVDLPGVRVCPECGEVVSDGDVFCMSCGHRLLAEPPAPVSQPTPRYCANCGAEIEEGFKFCGQCGAPVASS